MESDPVLTPLFRPYYQLDQVAETEPLNQPKYQESAASLHFLFHSLIENMFHIISDRYHKFGHIICKNEESDTYSWRGTTTYDICKVHISITFAGNFSNGLLMCIHHIPLMIPRGRRGRSSSHSCPLQSSQLSLWTSPSLSFLCSACLSFTHAPNHLLPSADYSSFQPLIPSSQNRFIPGRSGLLL